jgi:rubredoxin
MCPRCDVADIEEFGPVRSTLLWFRCRNCQHVWAVKPSPGQ